VNRFTTALAIALILTSAPALADNERLSQRERDERIAGCIRTHGAQHTDRCVEIMEGPSALGRRARQGYEWRKMEEAIERQEICQDDPRVVSPRVCFDAPVRDR
jgi:hypothetical protein